MGLTRTRTRNLKGAFKLLATQCGTQWQGGSESCEARAAPGHSRRKQSPLTRGQARRGLGAPSRGAGNLVVSPPPPPLPLSAVGADTATRREPLRLAASLSGRLSALALRRSQRRHERGDSEGGQASAPYTPAAGRPAGLSHGPDHAAIVMVHRPQSILEWPLAPMADATWPSES
jgi:hypothetical protein